MEVAERWDPRVGRRIGGYDIEAVLGRGGMGVVYRARNERSDSVALKLMAPEIADNPDYRVRFIQEADLGPRLTHSNIVAIHDSGEIEGELFIEMALVEGRDLKELLAQEGPLEVKRALRIFRQAAAALDAAHETGIVHRDIKPQNLLVEHPDSTGFERVFVSDFGLVRPKSSETSASKTQQVFGTVPYMAPELIEGLPVDGRADLYGLACVLFECLTGSAPFDRENEISTLWAHLHEKAPLVTDKRSELPAGLNDPILSALSKHPDDRFLTCDEFVSELETSLGRKFSKLKYGYVRPLVERLPRPKTEREVWAPNFFPELSRVRRASNKVNWWKVGAFVTACFVLVSLQVGREGGLPEVVRDAAAGVGSAGTSFIELIAPDRDEGAEEDRKVLAERETSINKEKPPATGGSVAKKLAPIGEETSVTPIGGSVSNGDVAYSSCPSASEDCEIEVARPDGSRRRTLTDNLAEDENPAWSPDGTKIAFTSYRDGNAEIYVMDADGSGERNITSNVGEDDDAAWSPDGKRIVFTSDRGGSADIYIVRVSDGEITRLTNNVTYESRPDWSPDGTKIAFSSCPSFVSGACDIHVIGVDGTGELNLTDHPAYDAYPSWSPDGTKIAFQSDRRTGAIYQIYVMDADGTDQTSVFESTSDEFEPDYSPDGRKLVLTSNRGPNTQVYVFTIASGESLRLSSGTGLAFYPSWGPRP